MTPYHRCDEFCEDPRNLFRERMQREERVEEFEGRIASHRAAGKNERLATYAAMKEMGYKSPAKEKLLHCIAKNLEMVLLRREKQRVHQKNYRERRAALKASQVPESEAS